MGITKGLWVVGSFEDEPARSCCAVYLKTSGRNDGRQIVEVSRIGFVPIEEAEANARLIATAVNACQKINPANPQAVAESIEKMHEVCKYLAEHGWNAGVSEDAKDAIQHIQQKGAS